jgi:LysM repeat protein
MASFLRRIDQRPSGMPSPPFSSLFSPTSSRRVQSGGNAQERLIPFPISARSTGEPEPSPRRRRRDARDLERPSPQRRARRRRQNATPWLQRNALSIAAVSVLVALLGLGFGLLQTITRPESSQALLAIGQSDQTATTATTASIIGPGPVLASSNANANTSLGALADAPREIHASAKIIEPSYTVQSGDTLGRIAVRFNTTVERIQALNNLPDPRALRIGARLVIPPPL